MSGAIEVVEESLNYSFKDASLLKLALTHPSFGSPNNQRLEFLGDAVLQLCVSTRLYATMTEADEGVMTRRRALLVQERSLYAAAMRMHINEALILGRGEQLSGGSLRRSILADSVESVIGAVYLDGGFDAAKQVVARVLDNIDPDDWRDFKTELQEYTQGQGHGAPEYEIIAQSGPAHARVFTAVVFVEGKQLGSGEGNTKKNAQQAAARAAIGMLGL
jgi:ribonuclease-3